MYINDVLRRCDTLCPNEYSDDEKYRWCDDLSAMLTQEYLKKYAKVTLTADENGDYILPEGVTYEMIDRIIDRGHEIHKYDFRSYGIRYLYGLRGRFTMPECNRVRSDIDVVYIKKHDPIRNIVIEDEIAFYNDGFKIIDCDLREGDTVTVLSEGKTFTNVPILGIEDERVNAEDNTGGWRARTAIVPAHTFDELMDRYNTGAFEETVHKAEIKRIVTDETLCDAPYDMMYVDYVNAQICYYQRDLKNYNQNINLFNQRLNAYHAWLMERRTEDKDGHFMNWW